jgi:DNA (cytosine-5)-methyltransferase 1
MNNAEVIQVGNIYPDLPNFKNRTSGRVYDINGISPCINTCGGGHREPKIVVYEDRPNNMPKQQGGGETTKPTR